MVSKAERVGILDGVLTRNESGIWFHCGSPVRFSECLDCESEYSGCFVSYCIECDWDLPDCLEEVEETLLSLAVSCA
jgi:hypothetical protein